MARYRARRNRGGGQNGWHGMDPRTFAAAQTVMLDPAATALVTDSLHQIEGPIDALSEIGVTGLNRVSGFVYEELLPELRGERGKKAIRMMIDEDPVIGAILLTIEMLCRQVSFDVTPASDSNADMAVADFFKGVLFDDMSITWQDSLSEILTFVPWGFEWTEVVYKQRNGDSPKPYKDEQGNEIEAADSRFNDGKIGIRKMSPRAQETVWRWVFDDRGGVRGMVQHAPPHYRFTEIPIEKSLLFRTTSRKGSPEGRSLLRNAYTSWYYKRNIQRIEAIGIERDLAGLPVALVPPVFLSKTANADQMGIYAEIKKAVTNVRRDEQEGLVLPQAYDKSGHPLFDFKLLSSGGSRQFDTTAIVQRYDQRIAQSLMAEFIMLGMDKVGSFALASSKTNLFSIALGTFLDMICEVINRHLIKKLMLLNGFPMERMPSLTHGDIESVPLDELAQYLTALANAGYPLFPSPDQGLEKHLLEIAGLPWTERPEPEEPEPGVMGNAPPGVGDEEDEMDEEAGQAVDGQPTAADNALKNLVGAR